MLRICLAALFPLFNKQYNLSSRFFYKSQALLIYTAFILIVWLIKHWGIKNYYYLKKKLLANIRNSPLLKLQGHTLRRYRKRCHSALYHGMILRHMPYREIEADRI